MSASDAGARPVGTVKTVAGGSDQDTRTWNITTTEEGHTIVSPIDGSTVSPYTPGKHWAAGPLDGRTISLASRGPAADAPETVYAKFKKAVANSGSEAAMKVERPVGTWKTWTWLEYYNESIDFARALLAIDFQRGDCVNIIGFNSPEWVFSNMGAIAAGGLAAGIYTSNEPEACRYIVNHSGARVVVVENLMQLAKFTEGGGCKDTKVTHVVMWDDAPLPEDLPPASELGFEVFKYRDFVALGADVDKKEVETRITETDPEHACTLIYTSGTTGPPKAVMATNDNCVWTATLVAGIIPTNPSTEEAIVSYLPLSHIAAQMLDIHSPINFSARAGTSACVYFARPTALKDGSLVLTMQAARPTYFFGVPRVWEKMGAKIKAKGAKSGLKYHIGKFAKSRGLLYWKRLQCGESHKALKKPRGFGPMEKIAFKKIRAALGLDRCRVFYTGAAPIHRDVLAYFGSLNIHIMELYGMSECTGPQTISTPGIWRAGSTGPCLPGTELMLYHEEGRDPPGQGEICYRGRHIMLGYMGNADKTAETIDENGWLHSGDVGRIDEHGLLFITGRIKELLITKGGENIAPVPVEQYLKKILTGVSNAMMIGDQRKYCSIIFTLKTEPSPAGDGTFTDRLDADALAAVPDSDATTVAEAKSCPKWNAYLQGGLDDYNSSSVLVSKAAKIQYFRVLDGDFTVPGGELGPTLKLRRPIVTKLHHDVIESMYESAK